MGHGDDGVGRVGAGAGTASGQTTIAAGVLAALAYADVFGWPLTVHEIHRTLPVAATLEETGAAVEALVVDGVVASAHPLYALAARDDGADPFEERRRRELTSARVWRRARRAAAVISRLPFVRMVAVSGSLAVDAADEHADIDLFVVTEDHRLWTARALMAAVVRAASVTPGRRWPLCPNYLVTESTLVLTDRDRFTAHELAQLVPLAGADAYERLLRENAWYRDFLPNHDGRMRRDVMAINSRAGRWLPRAVVERFERWERDRKVARLRGETAMRDARFDDETCKGHVDGHRPRIMAAYEARLARFARFGRLANLDRPQVTT